MGSHVTAIDIHVGARIRMRRIALKLTVEELSRYLRIPTGRLSDLEAGNERLDVVALYRISETLEVPMAWFFDNPNLRMIMDNSSNASNDPGVLGRELSTQEGKELLGIYYDALGGEMQKKLVSMASILAEADVVSAGAPVAGPKKPAKRSCG